MKINDIIYVVTKACQILKLKVVGDMTTCCGAHVSSTTYKMELCAGDYEYSELDQEELTNYKLIRESDFERLPYMFKSASMAVEYSLKGASASRMIKFTIS